MRKSSSPFIALISLIPVLSVFICRTFAQSTTSSTATWQFPLQDGLTINYIDTVVLQWTSNYNTAWMNMWCQKNGTTGNNVVLGSQFMVQPSGSFPYIMFTEDPTQADFPVACHAELMADKPNGVQAQDDPVGITFTSNTNVEAKTFSSSASSTSSSISSSSSSSIPSVSSSSSSTASSSSPSSLASPISSNNPSTPSPTSQSISRNSSSSGLSSGAKAGIGIGAAAIALPILGTTIAYMIWRRRRAARARGPSRSVVELDNKEVPGVVKFGKYELEAEGRGKHEMPGSVVEHELEQEEPRYEMWAGQ